VRALGESHELFRALTVQGHVQPITAAGHGVRVHNYTRIV
jgi:hypothetical protein